MMKKKWRQPAFELADARKLAKELQVELSVIEYDILSCPEVAANPADRVTTAKRLCLAY